MVWVLAVVCIYLILQVAVCALSVRPYRIPGWISMGSLGKAQESVEFLSSDDVHLRGWWSPTPGSDKIAVLCHGYMMNRSEMVPEANHLAEQGYSCLLFDFRAHGKSAYAPSSIGFRERMDVVAAVKYARSRQPGSKVLLIGSSMGSAASAFAVADDPSLADALILDSAYSRMSDAISGWWNFLGGKILRTVLYPTRFIAGPIFGTNPFRVDVAEALIRIGEKPVLFFHGRCDTLAEPSGAERNYVAAVGPKKIVWFEGCNHSEARWLQAEAYRKEMGRWLTSVGLL
jgi:pimeloyl-ACP methyl ester carboxylesterase